MTAPIIIDFERAGGYAGLNLHATIDSHSLSADESEELVRLLREASIKEIRQEPATLEPSPDQFTYTLSIQWGKEHYFFRLAEKQIPSSVRPLLRFLTLRGRIKKEHK